MIDKAQILQEFPEARESYSSGHLEYYVHCRKSHKKGGIYKMSINSETGVYYCHDCGATGNVINDYLGIENQFRAFSIIRDEANKKESIKRYLKEWQNGVPTPGELIKMSDLDSEHPAMVYLNKRGISVDQMDYYGLMYCQHGQFKFASGLGTTSGRIVFPVYMNGELVGWQARQVDTKTPKGRRAVWHGEKKGWMYPVLSDDKSWSDVSVPKYYTCPGMKRYSAIYNFDRAIAQGRDLVVVTEGPIDCIKVGQKSVCTFGSKITNQQVRILKANWAHIIWILDEDIDTESLWFKRLESELSDGNELTYMKLTNAKDPGESTKDEIWKEINNHYKK